MTKEKIKKILKELPDRPGVYFFRDKKRILYIGKATSLRARAKSYFAKDILQTRGPLILDMAFKASKIDWQETDSVLEALILEANLIKKSQPYYNVREKDDKSWNYVCITKETLPKAIVVRGRNLDNYKGSYYGPFTQGLQLREAMKIIRRIFPYLDDKSKNYLEFYRQINLAPDVNDRKLYLQNIKNIKLFFSGKKKKIFENLKKEMKAYARSREFERAGEIKRQIFALQHISDVALLKLAPSAYRLEPISRIEAYDVAHMSGKNIVGVMTVLEDGRPAKSEYRKFNIRTQTGANDTGALAEIIGRRLEHAEWRYPNLIVLDGGKAQVNSVAKLFEKVKVGIPVVAVVKDERHRPKQILGNAELTRQYEREILIANSEAHRFAIAFHKLKRSKSFLE